MDDSHNEIPRSNLRVERSAEWNCLALVRMKLRGCLWGEKIEAQSGPLAFYSC